MKNSNLHWTGAFYARRHMSEKKMTVSNQLFALDFSAVSF